MLLMKISLGDKNSPENINRIKFSDTLNNVIFIMSFKIHRLYFIKLNSQIYL